MDKLKNILKSDTPAGDQPTSNSGRLAGQGSHFPGKEETSTTGTTVTGTDPLTRGPADVSAAPTSTTAAAATAGPEQGGSSHIGTTPAATTRPLTQTAESSAANTTSPEHNTRGPSTYTISNPQAERSVEGSGTAAIGQTSTYSTARLPQGNPTSSVIDPDSSDPLTYKKPETGTHSADAGVGAGAAATAAGLAFTQGEERRKSGMAGSENPYRADHLDPRVDGLSRASAERATSTAPTTVESSRDSALGTGTSTSTGAGAGAGAGTGLAAAGATSAFNTRSHEQTAPPSSLTTSADPTSRSAEYQATTAEKGLGSDSAITPETSAETDPNRQSVVGRVLGAVGLGGVASAIGAGTASSGDTTALAETPAQPTTTTGLESYTAPTEQGPPTTHHRKESIPTTAYPSGTFDSPRAINPPVGGSGSPVVHGDREHHTGRNVATGVATGGAAAGAAAIAAHDTEQPSSGLSSVHHATTVGDGATSGSLGTTPLTTSGAPTTLTTAGTTPATTKPTSAAAGTTASTTGTVPATGTPSTSVGPASTTTTTTTPATTDRTAVAPATGIAGTTGTTGIPGTTGTTSSTGTTGLTGTTGTTGLEKAADHQSTTTPTGKVDTKDHTSRDTALGAGAGAAAVGAGAYGAHEYSKREAEKADAEAARERAAHEKELAKQKAEQQKELEKQHKAEEKAAAKEERRHEKEEHKHQKELEKEEKKHQKELEKEKEHEAEKAAVAERREREKEHARLTKQREEEEEERRNRAEKERLLGAAGAGAAAGAVGAEATERDEDKEKKPSIFKRIFKRRKNPKTGEDEEYESDEDKNHAAKEKYGAAVYEPGLVHDKSGHTPTGTTVESGPTDRTPTKYEEQSGGVPKPSYNPFSKDRPEAFEPAVAASSAEHSATTAPTSSAATHGTSKEAITGLPYDASKDPEAAARLGTHTHGEGIGHFDKKDAALASAAVPAAAGTAAGTHGSSTAPSDLESTGTRSAQPAEAITGTTASTHSKPLAPTGLESSGAHTQQPSSTVTGLPDPEDATRYSGSTAHTTGQTGEHIGEHAGGFHPNTNFTLGEIQESHGLGEKIKEALHLGGHKKEGE